MNRTEAKLALSKGKTLTHSYFSDDEWVRGKSNRQYIFEDGCECDSELFWADRSEDGFDDGWSLKNIVIEDKCTCGEPIRVEINAKISGRTDKKRPHYHDSSLPEGLDPNLYSADSVTVFRCRNCLEMVDETVQSATFEKLT